MPRMIMGIKTYTTEEASAMLGVTRRSLSTYIADGRLKGQRIARRWYFTEANLKAFVRGDTQPSRREDPLPQG